MRPLSMREYITNLKSSVVGWELTQPCIANRPHYIHVITGAMASQITSLTIVYSSVYSDADQRKHQSFASLVFVRTGEFPAQTASNEKNGSIWWRHRDRKLSVSDGVYYAMFMMLHNISIKIHRMLKCFRSISIEFSLIASNRETSVAR